MPVKDTSLDRHIAEGVGQLDLPVNYISRKSMFATLQTHMTSGILKEPWKCQIRRCYGKSSHQEDDGFQLSLIRYRQISSI